MCSLARYLIVNKIYMYTSTRTCCVPRNTTKETSRSNCDFIRRYIFCIHYYKDENIKKYLIHKHLCKKGHFYAKMLNIIFLVIDIIY